MGNVTQSRSNILCSNQLCSEKFNFPSGVPGDVMVNMFAGDDLISTSTIGKSDLLTEKKLAE